MSTTTKMQNINIKSKSITSSAQSLLCQKPKENRKSDAKKITRATNQHTAFGMSMITQTPSYRPPSVEREFTRAALD
jgi:hypothetical protein